MQICQQKNCNWVMLFYDGDIDQKISMYPDFAYKGLLRVGLGGIDCD